MGEAAMIGITAHRFEVGKHLRSVEEIALSSTERERQEMHRIGLEQIPTENETQLESMIASAWSRFPEESRPDCVLIAHSLPFIRRSYCLSMPCGTVPTFYLSGLPCAIMHKAVDVACRMLKRNMYHRVMVIGADKAYSDQERIFFNTIMGDAAVLLLLEREAPENQILAQYISTTVYAADGENSDSESVQRFRNVNASLMRDAIRRCMKAAEVEQVNYFVTHTSNRLFWDVVSALCGYPRDIFLDGNICNTGHMNSHDSFFHYFYWKEQGVLKTGDLVMLINPGFGGTQGCTLLRV